MKCDEVVKWNVMNDNEFPGIFLWIINSFILSVWERDRDRDREKKERKKELRKKYTYINSWENK